jgi:hypothetical protein
MPTKGSVEKKTVIIDYNVDFCTASVWF